MTNPQLLYPQIPTKSYLIILYIALNKAREAFISSENSDKICCALSNNIRTSGDVKYITGDKVYYKRANDR